MAQVTKRERQAPLEGAPKRTSDRNPLEGRPIVKSPASQVLALHLSNMQLTKLEAEWSLGADHRIDGIELHRRVLCEKRVSEQEVLDAIKNADALDPKTRSMLSEIAKESGFASVREAAKKALKGKE